MEAKGACRPERIAAITLFAEDLQASRDFYQRLLDLPVVFEDADSFVVNVGGTLVNVLAATAAASSSRRQPSEERTMGRVTCSRFQWTTWTPPSSGCGSVMSRFSTAR